MRTAGALLIVIALVAYLGIGSWIFIGNHADEPLTGAQGTFWTLSVFGPLLLGIGLIVGAEGGGRR